MISWTSSKPYPKPWAEKKHRLQSKTPVTQLKIKNKTALIFALLITISISSQLFIVHAQSPVIVVNPSPAIINADGKTHQIIVVELQTENGQPYPAPRDTPIHITSSNLNIGTIDEFATIPEGKTYTKVSFTARKTSGITIITASSPGYVTGDEYLQVLRSNFDARLVVYATPSNQPAVVGESGRVLVQIVDSLGNPYLASDNVAVTLTSSNHSICTVTQNLIIDSGTNYAVTEFTVTGDSPGESVITAQAQGYAPGSDLINTYNVPEDPEIVSIYFSPDVLLPDEQVHEAITVQLQDKEGSPVPASTTTIVYLSSSSTNIATVEQTVTINSGQYKTVADLTTYLENGESIISASSPGLLSDSETIQLRGQVPTNLALFVFPELMTADESVYDIITVQLQDNEGNPIEARKTTEIFLTSTNIEVGTVPSSVIIPQGDSYSTTSFTTTSTSGTTSILASMMGIRPSEKSIQTITKEFNMTLSTPNAIKINQTFTVQVELSSGGLPVSGAQIEWTALGGVILSEDSISNDDGVATAQITQKFDNLRLKIVATKTGYEAIEAQKNIQAAQQIEETELTVTILGREILVFHILIGLAAIIAVILAAYVYIKYRKSREDEPEDLEIYT